MSSTERFSFDTITEFDKHIEQSIPNYDLLSDGVVSLSRYFLDPTARVYDLGCSTGRMLKEIPHQGEKVGIDNSDNLLPQGAEFVKADLNEPFDFSNACLATSVFTLQFLRPDRRELLVQAVYKGLNQKGGFILAEKTYATDAQIQEMMTFGYYDFKRKHFTDKEIMEKEITLREIMKPNTSQENQEMLERCGFIRTQLFWKFFNFEAWVCIK